LIQSFGFKYGLPPDADFVFDIRCLNNPYWKPELRALTGKDLAVIAYLQADEKVKKMVLDINNFLKEWVPNFAADNRSYLTVAIGCTGGQHRSVYVTEAIASQLKTIFKNLQVRHRELNKI